ncbi:tripartite tricarboxylate transporter TctB family protein [Paracoccus laeviglucosivorans]|uniref:Tripartite tricarboxylate transporter TctB family protein n=1 Tax=Paracoccus laeviglucosivorans TaxID=1197861 RepID=A0A521ETX9_9RHOB|nr:tripartite tricarboxylate transporter TctB family protein [Paracoccus laeviglucosivorans]SMO86560.1 Tripartite tricarboxylate transporter TctB family protein [Paracoccus laeviglucosivorans]
MADLPIKFLSRDSIAGLGIAIVGAGFSLASMRYGVGSLTTMGAGFFPFAVGVVTTLIGLAVFGNALRETGEAIERPELRSVLFVAASVVIFALMIDKAGMVPTILVCGTVCAIADRQNSVLQGALLSAGLAAGIWLVFVKLLGMPIPVLGEL